MDAEHILEHMRFLHSDVARQTLAILERLERTAQVVESAATRAETALVAQRASPQASSRDRASSVDSNLHAFFELQVNRLEQIATTVKISATEVNTGRTLLHKQNEAFLMSRVAEIAKLIEKLVGVRNEVIAVAQEQADMAVAPVILQLSHQVEKLAQKDAFAAQSLKRTVEIHAASAEGAKRIAANMKLALLSTLIIAGMLFLGGFYFGERSTANQKADELRATTSSDATMSDKSAEPDRNSKN